MKLRSLFVLAALSLTACTGVNPPKQPREDKYASAQIHVTSEELRRDTAVGTPIIHRDANDLVHVTFEIRSAIDKELYIDYWVTWFDRDGQPLGKFGPAHKTLQPHTPDRITVISTTPRAADFQVDIRYAR